MAYSRKRKGTSSRTFKRKGIKRSAAPNRRRLTNLIKSVVMRKAEPKVKRANFGKMELYHNTFQVGGGVMLLNDATLMPTQGPGDNQRIGDQINVTGIKIKSLFGQKGDRPNVSFRYFVLQAPKGVSPTYANFFINITGNILLDDPNTDIVKVLKTGIMRPNEAGLSATGNDEYTFAKRWWLPYKKLIKFGPADAATTHNDNDMYLIVMPYDAFGSLGTDNIAYMQASVEIYYKDP